MLFANVDPYIVAGAAIAVLAAFAREVKAYMDKKHIQESEVRVWSITEAQKEIEKQDKRINRLEEEQDKTNKSLAACERDRAVLFRWVEWVTPEIEKSGIRVPKFDLDDSATHLPLRTPGGNNK